MTKKLTRKTVELAHKRIPLRKLLHGKDIRTAAKALEDFRLVYNEQEILFGATLTVKMDTYGEAVLYAHRPETDKEYADRLEKARLAEEAKKEREAKRKLMVAEKAKRDAEMRKQNVAQRIKEMATSNGVSIEELTEMLKNT
jgi:hypothetical protein